MPLPGAPRTTDARTTRPARTQSTAVSEPCPRGDGSAASQACSAHGPPAPTRSREAAPRRLRSRPQTRSPSRRPGAHLSRGAGQRLGLGPGPAAPLLTARAAGGGRKRCRAGSAPRRRRNGNDVTKRAGVARQPRSCAGLQPLMRPSLIYLFTSPLREHIFI